MFKSFHANAHTSGCDGKASAPKGAIACCVKKCTLLVAAIVLSISGCAGRQSALEPAGYEAQRIAYLWWWMLAGAITVWLVMIGLSYYAIFAKRRQHFRNWTVWVVIGGGVVFPTTILTTLLCLGLAMLPPLVARAPEGSLVIDVEGIQWWWRVNYPDVTIDGEALEAFETANEICIPVDEPVEFRLQSHDVIHAFWIPSLGGKVDMIPGRITRLTVHPFRIGRYRGVCAEYCGDSHALMNFDVRVVSRADFEKWLMHQVSQASQFAEPGFQRGRAIFQQSGCGACHTVRGTGATGSVGPDLTHFGSRLTLAAGIYDNNSESIAAWLRSTEHIKPGVHMPNFEALGESQLSELASYLEQLK